MLWKAGIDVMMHVVNNATEARMAMLEGL